MTPLLEYLQQMFMLHRLVDLGLGDSPLAEQVREAMDGPWRQLAPAEIEEVDAVSGRLNAERDLATAIATDRIEELDRIMQHLAAAYWKEKAASDERATGAE